MLPVLSLSASDDAKSIFLARNITDNIGKLETKYWNITNFWAFLIDFHQ